MIALLPTSRPAIGFVVAVLVFAFAAASPSAAYAAEDVHDLFEVRCGRCHAHAGDLAQKITFDPNGRLIGAESARDIRRFLDRHHAGDTAAAEVIYALFARQVARGGAFRDRCAICHVRARQLVQERLAIQDGRVVGRFNGRDVGTFLVGHARLGAAEAEFFRDVLQQIAEGL